MGLLVLIAPPHWGDATTADIVETALGTLGAGILDPLEAITSRISALVEVEEITAGSALEALGTAGSALEAFEAFKAFEARTAGSALEALGTAGSVLEAMTAGSALEVFNTLLDTFGTMTLGVNEKEPLLS